jgi:GNAT superfamily N-acetyltransferase
MAAAGDHHAGADTAGLHWVRLDDYCGAMMDDSFCVINSHPQLITYVDWLQRKNAESLSFYPRCTFERESERGRIFLGLLNGEPCGYIYVGAGTDTVKCHQVCIQYDARRRLYGAQLVAHAESWAVKRSAYAIQLRCGFDLLANDFWKSLGYVCVATVDGGIRRQRRINVWRKALMPELFLIDGIDPERGSTDASLWRRNKHVGIVTQFSRGVALNDYRAIVRGKRG